jgi:hypothetical protein
LPTSFINFSFEEILAQALVGEIIQDTMNDLTFNNLLNIIASPSHEISLVALKECFKLFDHYPKLTWSAIYFAFALCKNHLKYRIYRLDKYPEANKN